MTLPSQEGSGGNLFGLDICLALKTFYLGTAVAILFAYMIPPLKDRFLAYGARVDANRADHHAVPAKSKVSDGFAGWPSTSGFKPLMTLFNILATLQVPHSWFVSFYCISVVWSLVWGQQLLTRGILYQTIVSWTEHGPASMSLDQITLCWSLMALQGARRLWECLLLSRPSQSRMWVFHWLVGVLFYVATGVSVWIEGVPALESNDQTLHDMRLSAPSLRVVVFLLVFLLASLVQNRAHVHLASLKKYSLPSHPAFSKILCPHYTAECVLYLALTCLAAPQGYFVNETLLCATIFVVVNLGVSADISKKWAMEKFGVDKVAQKWRMLPGLW